MKSMFISIINNVVPKTSVSAFVLKTENTKNKLEIIWLPDDMTH